MRHILSLLLSALLVPATFAQRQQTTAAGGSPPGTYSAELVASAASGVDLNDRGDVIGTSYTDPGCGSTCLPPEETVVWRNGNRIVLPSLSGLTGNTVTGMNNQGWIVGYAGSIDFTHHAVLWKPGFAGYSAIDLGTLPGRTGSAATGVDELGRVVGWSSSSPFPFSGSPFMWTESGGIVDLAAQGFPDEAPLGVSPGGTIASLGFWYRLDDVTSVVALTPPPATFLVVNSLVAINDEGNQARFLISTGPENLAYPFRVRSDGSWQQISFSASGHLSPYGIGAINDAGDVSLTVQGTGMIAYGPDELAQPLGPLVSPAYGGGAVTSAGSINANGEILARIMIGRAARLVRLAPAAPCTTNCVKVPNIVMRGRGPGFCNQGQNEVRTRLIVSDAGGTRVPGARVSARYFDDYWLDKSVVGQTDALGRVSFIHRGPPCVGAIAFLVTDVTIPGVPTNLDRTTGMLANFIIPTPTDPIQASAIAAENSEATPSDYSMERAYPNPFNPATTIRFSMPVSAAVQLRVYNVLGSEVARLVDGNLEAGEHEVHFDASPLPSGMYFARLTAGSFTQIQRLTLLK